MLAQLLLTIILLPQGKLILWWTNKVEDREEKWGSWWCYWCTGPILFQNLAYFWATTFSLLFKPVWVKFYLKLEVFLTLNHNHLNTLHLKISVFHMFSYVQLSAAPLTVAHKAPQSIEFSKQEYWSGLPFPTPRCLPDQGLNPRLLQLLHWQVNSLPLMPPGKPHMFHNYMEEHLW